MRLYGSVTSPFVRRVRVVADELSLPITLVDSFTDEGQRELREQSPVWKVPAAKLDDGRVLWDSALILEAMLEGRAPGPFACGGLEERLFIATVDEALLCLVRRFYLAKDGVDVDGPPYLAKEKARAGSILGWASGRLEGGLVRGHERFGLAELALYTALDWMRFRATWPVDDDPALRAFLAAHAARPSLVATAPPRA